MAHMDQAARLVDAHHIATCQQDPTQSNWGFFHEVGHNHQNYDWTFDGTVEVTVNLFTLYVYEHLCGIRVADNWRGDDAFRARQLARYDFDDPDFEFWKREPFLALVMYQQLHQEFGWESFRRVFAEYRALAPAERPRADADKRDQWLERYSRAVAHNLGPFFEAWGVPTSRAARDRLSDLPVWLPEGFPWRRGARLADLDDDGRDDVLLRHLAGRWYYYPMAGRRHVAAGRGAAELPADRDWSFAGLGDFDGVDGSDVLLRHTDGRWRKQPMAGRRQRAPATDVALPRSGLYRLAAIGDLDGDGRDEVLLRHRRGNWRYHALGATGSAGGAQLPGSLDWRLEGVGDFDGDGKDDVLLRNRAGSWVYYRMDGRHHRGRVRPALPTDPQWRLAAVGDFDADGRSDVLLRHQIERRWHYYAGAGPGGGSGVAHLTRNPAYVVAAVGDLDGDGRDDLLLRRNDGAWYLYAMDGRRVRARGGASLTRSMAWAITRP